MMWAEPLPSLVFRSSSSSCKQTCLPCTAVTAYNAATRKHTLLYDDGECESLLLAFEDWVFADGTPPLHASHLQWQLPAADASAPGTHSRPASAGHRGAGAEPPLKRARTPSDLAPVYQGNACLAPTHAQGAWNSGAAAQAAPLIQQQPQVQQEQAAVEAVQLPPGLPAADYAGPRYLQPWQQSGAPCAAGDAVSAPLSTQVPQLRAPARIPPAPAAALPQELVAGGRHYRAFTAATLPPGFEIFALLPGLTVEEVSVAGRCCIECAQHSGAQRSTGDSDIFS